MSDKLSDLPDPLLHRVMPHFKAREAVQTCIWSTKWKNFWISLPYLNFDMREFMNDINEENVVVNDNSRQRRKKIFIDFVNIVLARLEETVLDSFELSCKELVEELYYPSVRNWIVFAVEKNPRVLRIDHAYDCSILPRCIFTCESLEELYLNVCCWTHLEEITPDVINLPRLKILHLHGLDIADGKNHGDMEGLNSFHMLRKIFSANGNPLLEDVWIEKLPIFASLRIDNLRGVSRVRRGVEEEYQKLLARY